MLAASPASAPVLPSKLPFKRLSFEEMAVHRDKGLCYHCDDKWVTGHRCKPSLHFLIADEDGEIADTSIPPEEPADPSLPQFPQISLNALAELSVLKTFRIYGTVLYHKVVILVDGDSTHNFIQTRVG